MKKQQLEIAFLEALNSIADVERKFLLAISGGVDSMVMLQLFHKEGLTFEVAHCNYMLRGEASDKDEELVVKYCKKHNIIIHIKKINTPLLLKENKNSLQVLAREIRYQWFKELLEEKSLNYVVTAHHANDNLETILYNFTKGTGLRGLQGIPSKNGNIIRPLLAFSKEELANYASKQNILYREDASNLEDKYARNIIRLKVIPELERINPALVHTAKNNAHLVKSARDFANERLETLKRKLCTHEKAALIIDFEGVKSIDVPAYFLYENLFVYGFNATQVWQLLAKDIQTGKQFFSTTHRLIIDRKRLVVVPIEAKETSVNLTINARDTEIPLPIGRLQLEVSSVAPNYEKNPHKAYFDYEKIDFPLRIRNWKEGDNFEPFGMAGKHKKISDLLTDLKYNIIKKSKTLLLISGREIIWVIGSRASEVARITDETKRFLTLTYIPD